MKYKGKSNVKTNLGAFSSFIVVFLIIVYLGNAITMVIVQAPGVIAQTTHLRSDKN